MSYYQPNQQQGYGQPNQQQPYGQRPPPAQQQPSYGNYNTSAPPPNYAQRPPQQQSQQIYSERPPPPIDYSKLDQPKNIQVTAAPAKYPDLWATITFLLALVAFFVLAGLGVPYLNSSPSNSSSSSSNSTTTGNSSSSSSSNKFTIKASDIYAVLGIGVGVSFALSIIYLFLLQRFAGKMIHASFIVNIVLQLGAAVLYFLVPGGWLGGVIMIFFAALTALFYWTCRFRIPFAKVMLKNVVNITGKYPATIFTSFIGAVLTSAFSVLWIVTLSGLINRFQLNSNQNALTGLTVYLLFFLYWTSQVIANVVHVTVSGLFATVYFMGTWNPTLNKVEVPVKNPTAQAAKRALTTSFGPICFGSLLVALIETIRALAQNAQNRNADDGNIGLAICCCILSCILGCIQGILEYFNTYAYVQVAIYGKGYWDAGKATWEMFKARSFDPLINDNIIGSVLGLGALLVALICAAIGFGYGVTRVSDPNKNTAGIIFAMIDLVVGGAIFGIMTNVIQSGVVATYVCLAEDPATMARNQPDLFARIQATYPQVNWGARSYVAA